MAKERFREEDSHSVVVEECILKKSKGTSGRRNFPTRGTLRQTIWTPIWVPGPGAMRVQGVYDGPGPGGYSQSATGVKGGTPIPGTGCKYHALVYG